MAGQKSLLAVWMGGAAAVPPVVVSGTRSMFAFWMGGASGRSSPSSSQSSSGEHRLANARRQTAKDTYQSIDWNSPIFGESPRPEVLAKAPELLKKPIEFKQEQNELSDIDREIQSLLKSVIAQEGTVAELAAIEKSIRETDRRLLEAERITAERLLMKRLALLLLLSAV